jgi:hypothetical protein
MHDLIARYCGVDVNDNRYVIVGCECVPGFEAVERGEKVDIVRVQPGIVDLAKATIADYPGAPSCAAQQCFLLHEMGFFCLPTQV